MATRFSETVYGADITTVLSRRSYYNIIFLNFESWSTLYFSEKRNSEYEILLSEKDAIIAEYLSGLNSNFYIFDNVNIISYNNLQFSLLSILRNKS